MSNDFEDTYDYSGPSYDASLRMEVAFWDQTEDPFAPGPMRKLPPTHNYWQAQSAGHITRSISHPQPPRFHRRIQKKQGSYDLREDFIHHAPQGEGPYDDGSASDVPSSPLSTLSFSSASSRTSSSVPSSLSSGAGSQPSHAGSQHLPNGVHIHSWPVTPNQQKLQSPAGPASKKSKSWPLLRSKSGKNRQ